jgi:hypothetical protein
MLIKLPEVDAEKVFQAADRKRRREKKSWWDVARTIGFTQSNVFTQLGRGRVPTTPILFPILLWIGETDLAAYRKDPVGEQRGGQAGR